VHVTFFGSYYDKVKPIGTEFYVETSAHMARSPANLWCPLTNGGEKRIFLTSCHQSNASFTHFQAADFRDI